ncbi:MAG: hypothetical protein ABEI86_06070 [Halobacteriaceae archaeon]
MFYPTPYLTAIKHHMVWFRQYLSDFVLLIAGVLSGNILTVSLSTALDINLSTLLGLRQAIPSFGIPLLTSTILVSPLG